MSRHKCHQCGNNLTSKTLSERELQVVKLVAEGKKNAAIGNRLKITEKTVKFHLTNIFKKLGMTSRFEVISAILTGKLKI